MTPLAPLPQGLAYVDPGSGAMLWQVLLAAGFGALFYVRKAVSAVRGWFGLGGDDASPKG